MVRLTRAQMKQLAYLISVSKDINKPAKRVVLWLLYKTDRLTKPVCLCMNEKVCGKLAENVSFGVHDMSSCNGTTHLGSLVKLTGSKFVFWHHCGVYSKGGKYDPRGGGCTIWISPNSYDDKAEQVVLDLKAINNVKLVEWDTLISEF